MDFLDPKKQRAHLVKLFTGYVLVAVLILLATTIFLYQAYGFGIHKGKIIQNGLVFFSSQPSGASVYLNGQQKNNTNDRLVLQAGKYKVQIQKTGFRTWQRAVTIEGGQVERFDYPFLFPTTLKTTTADSFALAPSLATQSLDHRWLLTQQPGNLRTFNLYDLNNPQQVKITTIALPVGLLSPSTSKQSIKVVQWASDNQHVLLEHTFGTSHEYILLDSQHPERSLNLNNALSSDPTTLTLQSKQYDKYFVYDGSAKTLGTDSLSNPAIVPLVQNIAVGYATYGDNIVLYAGTAVDASGKQQITLYQNNTSYPIQKVPAHGAYLLDLTKYSGDWYVVAGASSQDKVYVYKNPTNALDAQPYDPLVPIDVLKVDGPTYEAFSASAQFIAIEHGAQFAAYDIENDKTYAFAVPKTFDASQVHATWMDGDRLEYVSDGKLVVFDYDGTNVQTLVAAAPSYTPFFDGAYHDLYTLAPTPTSTTKSKTTKTTTVAPAVTTMLTQTSLLVP